MRLPNTYLLVAVGSWAALRLVGLAAVYASRNRGERSLISLLSSFDGDFYLSIASGGYDHGPQPDGAGGLSASNLAFHPLLPGLIRILAWTPLSISASAMVVAAMTGLAAAIAIYRCGELVYGPRIAVLLTILWGILPHAIVESMAYTESLFTALAAWTITALVRRQWLTAGLLCCVTGLTRPTATALIATVGITALVAICQRRDGLQPWLAMAVAPVGLLGYWVWVGVRLGRVDGWFWVQRTGWDAHFDGGRATAGQVVVGISEPQQPAYLVTSLVVVVFGILILILATDRPSVLPMVAFSLTLFVIVAGTAGSYHSKGRLLLPAFAALIPIASALAATRRSTIIAWLSGLAVVSFLYGSYLLTVWPLSP